MPKFSDEVSNWLHENNYKCCFFVAGGNIMHLMESFSKKFLMVPVIHEVTAAIAADYFNEVNSESEGKAFALVTLGPGVTNTTTGVMGSFLDSRELLLIAGQVKSEDLKRDSQRQRGIQEIDGISLFRNISKATRRITEPIGREEFVSLIENSKMARKGPVYIEICLDAQGAESIPGQIPVSGLSEISQIDTKKLENNESDIAEICKEIDKSKRPLFYIGGGVDRSLRIVLDEIEDLSIPVCTSWNAADRVDSSKRYFAGRPNLYGQRFANIFLQQSDLIVIFGSSMGLQSTGFNFKDFAPGATIIQIDIDSDVLNSSNLKLDRSINGDANHILIKVISYLRENAITKNKSWVDYLNFLKEKLPIVENREAKVGYVNPFIFINKLTKQLGDETNIVPCSSGGIYTSSMQVIEQNGKNIVISSKGLGSMGYGLAGAIGACIANQNQTILFEGDGGFAQNIQELGVVSSQKLDLKIFVFNNDGYASIRSTQNRYFKGNLVGSNERTGVKLPNLELIASAFNIQYFRINHEEEYENIVFNNFKVRQPTIFEIIIDPDLNYSPKIESKLDKNGKMLSQALQYMVPEIESSVQAEINQFLEKISE